MEHVDEYLRAAAWMGASPLPSVRSRVANLHAGCGPHSRDRGRRDRALCTTSQPRLKQVSRYIPEHWRTRPVCRLGCFQFERWEAEIPLLINFVIPTAMSTTPAGTKTYAVNQTANPIPITNTPPASHGQAVFTREGYPGWQIRTPSRSVAPHSLTQPGLSLEPSRPL